MAKRARKRLTKLDKAAAGIGRALGKAMSRIKGIDSESRKAMEVRGRTLQQLGRDAGRRIAYLGETGPTAKRRSGKAAKASRTRTGSSSSSGRRVAARARSRVKAKKAR